MSLWKTKTFRTREAMNHWIERHGARHQWEEIAVENAWGILCCRLRRVY